jgi:hypothetical protein
MVGERLVQMLMFADDIALVAESAEQLQEMLDEVFAYSSDWRFKVHQGKCQVMTVGGETPEGGWRFGVDGVIPEVDVIKYLGLLFSEKGVGREEVAKRIEKGVEKSGALKSLLRMPKVVVSAKVDVWKATTIPAMLYGAEITWPTKTEHTKMERVQLKAGKSILRCNVSTCNEAVRGDLGLREVAIEGDRRRLRWWGKVKRMGEDRLVKQVSDIEWNCSRREIECGRVEWRHC